jgi:predicted metal-dependent HD superfamily phosphohydrolase
MDTEKADLPGPDTLRTIWDKLAGKYCNDNELTNRFYEEIERKYTSNRRHYHNLYHIAALLCFCEQYAGELNDRDVVAFAVFYHDIIYNPLRKDNEARSAQLAVKRLQALELPDTAIEQVKLYIEATKNHAVIVAVTHIGDLQLFLDFDMSILAADWETYEAYTRQVRKEYRIYPDKLYYPGRKQFLQHCLQTEYIFQTEVFRVRYEGVAKENIGKELQLIGNRNMPKA